MNEISDKFEKSINTAGISTTANTSILKHRRMHRKGRVMQKVRSMESVSFNGLEFKGSWTTKTSRSTTSSTQSQTPSRNNLQRNEKASRFSGYASSIHRASLPPTPESNMMRDIPSYNKAHHQRVLSSDDLNNMFKAPSPTHPSTLHHRHRHNHNHHRHHRSSLSRPTSVASLTGLVDLDMPEPDEGMTGPIVTLMDVLKGGNVRSGALLHLIVLSLLLFVTLNDVVSRTISNNKSNIQFYRDEMSNSDQGTPSMYHHPSSPDHADTHHNKHHAKTKGLLGPAMIQSVTEALSPILPFAGGVDLRRDENWKSWNSWLSLWDHDKDIHRQSSTLSNTLLHKSIHSVSSIPRGGGGGRGGHKGSHGDETKMNSNNLRSDSTTTKQQLTFKTKQTLSTTEPFFPLKDIERMTLHEVVALFDYIATPNIDVSTYMKQKFPDHVNIDLLKRALTTLDDAVAQSRGKGVSSAILNHDHGTSTRNRNKNGPLSTTNGYGDIDALKFCAVMRIFAEWRVLRQVPPGYKQYSVGMNLGHKDIVQNIVKIETSIHKWIEERAELEAIRRADEYGNDNNSKIEPRSPTLREILQYEIDMDIHPTSKLPRLKDKTAAMGLLWVRRQLQYQTAVFKNIIDVPTVYPTTINAVTAAYAEVYGNLHGWTVQKIFNYSFQSAPDADLIYRHMNPAKLEKVFHAAKSGLVSSKQPPDVVAEDSKVVDEHDDMKVETEVVGEQSVEVGETDSQATIATDCFNVDSNVNSEGKNHFFDFFTNIGCEWDKLGKHVTNELDKIGKHVQGEWDKIIHGGNDVAIILPFGIKLHPRGGGNNDSHNSSNQMSDDEVEAYVSKQMADDAHKHILTYLEIVGPILNDISGLFTEMNMDDPTKV